MVNLIWAVVVVLFALWVFGLIFSVGGGLIHMLLVIAAVLIVFNLLTKGRATI